jgi:hypothetical protein
MMLEFTEYRKLASLKAICVFIVLAWPQASHAQARDVSNDYGPEPFDRILWKHSLGFDRKLVKADLEGYFRKFCNKSDLSELTSARFQCSNGICATSRTRVTQGTLAGNIVDKTWFITARLKGQGCPNLSVELGRSDFR